jgi:hypothetical protein
MIVCKFCGAKQVANTLFCNECGHYLSPKEDKSTDLLNTSQMSRAGVADSTPAPPATPTSSATLQLNIAQQLVIEVTVDKEVVLGRLDLKSTSFPTIDLSTLGAPAKSVSRRHARIKKCGSDIILEDLGSANGTFINGKKVQPFTPTPLHHGDLVHLGQLAVEAKIQYR